MSKHTPGPWEVVGFDPIPGVFYIDQSGDHGIPNLAEVKRRSGLGDDVNRANATLIAAAPELLGWIQAVVRQMDYEKKIRPFGNSGLDGMYDGLVIMIAKAKVRE
jgi:hypothetical protein